MTRPHERHRIHLAEERQRALLDSLARFYREAFDEDLSRFRAERLLEFFLKTLAPPVYNQAIQDARAFMAEKLEDLEVEFCDPRVEP